MQNTQLSIFDLIPATSSINPSTESTHNTPASIIPFPNSPKNSHPNRKPQQRVSPIRNAEITNQIYKALLNSGRYGLRNATIFALQLAIGRRTNDILRMTFGTVYDYTTNSIKPYIRVDEHKTGKTIRDLPIPAKTRELLLKYTKTLKSRRPDSLLFPSQKHNADGSQRPLNTASLDYIYQVATTAIYSALDIDQTHISSYAARKTFCYDLYMKSMTENNGFVPGTNIYVVDYLQSFLNHASNQDTMRYIGVYDSISMEMADSIAEKYDF